MTEVVDSRSIALEYAQKVTAKAVVSARNLGLAVCVAVVDRAGHLVCYIRMDGAPLLCEQLAQDKAYTVAAFGLASHEWWEMIHDDPALVHGLTKTDRLIVYGGGAPVTHAGEVVGAVGVSGGSADQDRMIAEAAAKNESLSPAKPSAASQPDGRHDSPSPPASGQHQPPDIWSVDVDDPQYSPLEGQDRS
jgi:uncharacterized protein GlcG (DUF336 family)